MNATFERRLRPVPVERRLGKTNTTVNNSRNDLRNKLNLTIRPPDARSLLRDRVRLNTKMRDARNLLRRRNAPRPRKNTRIPFFIPVKTVKNELYSGQINNSQISSGRRSAASLRRAGIPDLLSLPLPPIPNPLDFLNNSTPPSGLFANLLPFGELPAVTNSNTTTTATSKSVPKISPIQGFRLEIRNLQPSVTLDDVYELFSSVGSLRLCTVTRPGQAEVIYNHSADALEAIERYNDRELDGRPMRVTLTTPLGGGELDISTAVGSGGRRMASRLGPNNGGRKQVENQAKQVIRNSMNNRSAMSSSSSVTATATPGGSSIPMEVDADVVRKALFNISSSGSIQSRRPVDFSVSLR